MSLCGGVCFSGDFHLWFGVLVEPMESGNWCLLCHGCPSPCGDSAEFSLLSFVWCLSSWVLFSLWCFSDGALRYPGNALKSCVQELCPTNVFKNRC